MMTFFTGIIEGGAAFLNFVVEFVVFITALYYLLGEYCDTVLILKLTRSSRRSSNTYPIIYGGQFWLKIPTEHPPIKRHKLSSCFAPVSKLHLYSVQRGCVPTREVSDLSAAPQRRREEGVQCCLLWCYPVCCAIIQATCTMLRSD